MFCGVGTKDAGKADDAASAYERKLLRAMRAAPNRLAHWLDRGLNEKWWTSEKHRKLITINAAVFRAIKHLGVGSDTWLEWGSLLGHVRHGGVIPWDEDMDLGVMERVFPLLTAAFDAMSQSDSRSIIRGEWCTDPTGAWEGRWYHVVLKEDETVSCDVVPYRLSEDGTMLHCTGPSSWDFPSYNYDMIFPTKLVAMFGEFAWIPREASAVLHLESASLGQLPHSGTTNEVPFGEYDPVPFLMTHLHLPLIAERICEIKPFREIPVAPSCSEGMRCFGVHHVPFIVRGKSSAAPPLFNFDLDRFKTRAPQLPSSYAHEPSTFKQVLGIDPAEALRVWDQDDEAHPYSKYVYVDSPSPGLVRDDEVSDDLKSIGVSADVIQFMLSRKNAFTRFHTDPFDPQFGGGFQYLCQGQKLWTLMHLTEPTAFDTLYPSNSSEKILRDDIAMDELLTTNTYALWGKAWQGIIEGGDFIFIPIGIAHTVNSLEKSFGLVGYVGAPAVFDTDAHVQAVKNLHERAGVSIRNGFWERNPVGIMVHPHDSCLPAAAGHVPPHVDDLVF